MLNIFPKHDELFLQRIGHHAIRAEILDAYTYIYIGKYVCTIYGYYFFRFVQKVIQRQHDCLVTIYLWHFFLLLFLLLMVLLSIFLYALYCLNFMYVFSTVCCCCYRLWYLYAKRIQPHNIKKKIRQHSK